MVKNKSSLEIKEWKTNHCITGVFDCCPKRQNAAQGSLVNVFETTETVTTKGNKLIIVVTSASRWAVVSHSSDGMMFLPVRHFRKCLEFRTHVFHWSALFVVLKSKGFFSTVPRKSSTCT